MPFTCVPGILQSVVIVPRLCVGCDSWEESWESHISGDDVGTRDVWDVRTDHHSECEEGIIHGLLDPQIFSHNRQNGGVIFYKLEIVYIFVDINFIVCKILLF